MKIFMLTVSRESDNIFDHLKKVYVRDQEIIAIFPSEVGDGCLLCMRDGLQIAVNEPVHKFWMATQPPQQQRRIGDLTTPTPTPIATEDERK